MISEVSVRTGSLGPLNRTKKIKEHNKKKALVRALSMEVDKLVKENQRLTQVLEELVEQSFSSEQAQLRRMAQDLETAQEEVEALKGKWGRTSLS